MILKSVVFFSVFIHIIAALGSVNETIGPIKLHAKIGSLPNKYDELSEDDIKATKKITALVEHLIKTIPTGYKSFPPLDPFKKKTINTIHLNHPKLWLTGELRLRNLELIGLKAVSLQHFDIRINTSRVDFDLTLPWLSIDSDFQMQLTLSYLPLHISGHMQVVVYNLSVPGGVGIDLKMVKNREVFQLATADIDVHARSVMVNITKLKIGGETGEIEGFSISTWIDRIKQDFAVAVVNSLLEFVNKSLRHYPAEVFKAYLTT